METRRTRAPDAGVEWYDVYVDGHHEGFQAKYYDSLADAIGDMRGSVEAVTEHRTEMSSLTFVVPFNLTDSPGRKTDRKRWEDAKARWAEEIVGADRLRFALVCASDILDRLALAEHTGRRAFWFNEFELSGERLSGWWESFRIAAGDRYTPTANTDLGLGVVRDVLVVSEEVHDHIKAVLERVASRLSKVSALAAAPSDWDAAAGALPRSLEGAAIGRWAAPLTETADWIGKIYGCLEALETAIEDEDSPRDRAAAVYALRSAVDQLSDYVRGRWQVAGPGQCLVLEGRGGAGKTHFIVDMVRGLIEGGMPALAVSGVRFARGPWWAQLASALGVDRDRDTFLGALDAYGEAANGRVVIAVDAINESQDPWGWRDELPDLVASVRRFDHLALLVSCRAEYVDGIVKAALPDLPVARHQGVRWKDRNAIFDAYQEEYGVVVPEEFRRDAEIDLPLLVKLVCQLYASDNPPEGPIGRNDLFRAWVADRGRHIDRQLQLAPSSTGTEQAVRLIARALLRSPTQEVPADEVRADVDGLVSPGRQGWPWTLFTQLREAGVIDVIPADNGTESEVVRFPYDTMSSYLLVDQLLRDAAAGLAEDAAQRLASTPRLWSAAASVVPEHTSQELTGYLAGHATPDDAPDTGLMFARSLLHRSPEAISADTGPELAKLLTQAPVSPETVDVVVRLAAREHPHNADWLHEQLRPLAMAERDASWGIGSYDAYHDGSVDTLLRVLRDADSDPAKRRRAVIALLWLLETPNRPARDSLTKELASATAAIPGLLTSALEAFLGVDAPYAIERLLLVIYGALMLSEETDSQHEDLVEAVRTAWSDGLLPVNILVDDHVRGILEWAAATNIIELDGPVPAVGDHAPPGDAPTEEYLETRHNRDGPEPASSILWSCLTWMGDFHKYVMTSAVETFGPTPLPGRSADAVVAKDATVDMEWAGRWVAARAIEFGWTAERFEEFERDRREDAGRAANKPERFGKKYQWLAFHELMARLAANLQGRERFSDSPQEYRGPWQWFGRDIDPTLAPAVYVDGLRAAPNGLIDFADVSAATVDLDTPASAEAWALETSSFPAPDVLLDGHTPDALTLWRYEKWTRDAKRGNDRDQWVICQAWCVRSKDLQQAADYIEQQRADWGRWLPSPDREHHSYLGEGPWASSRRDEGWVPLTRSMRDDIGIGVLPATRGYLWEGGVTRDCSIDSSVNLELPDAELTEGLTFRPDTVTYSTEADEEVAWASRGRDGGQLTSIARPWLDQRLAEMDAGLVISIIGERLSNDNPHGEWRGEETYGTELWTVATYDPAGGLTHRRQYVERERGTKDPALVKAMDDV